MLTVSQIETASLATWPALETVADGHWRARFAGGFSGRSNSIWSLDPADDGDAAGRIATLSARYARHDLPAVFRVTPLTGNGILDTLDQTGWEPFKTSLVLSAPLTQTDGFDGAASLYDATDPAFLAAQTALQGFDANQRGTFAAILAALNRPACGIVIADSQGAPGASLLCVESDGIVMIYDVITAKSLRGQGFGRRMMASALSWGAENGASHAALQVQGDNSPAIALYLSMGFVFRYPYHYRRKPEAQAQ
ncbi:GNAT family N-acetyltransferase [Pelagibacterium sp.]|uniref:GNAT family N-acetyltransferase n=1 Tax=Pelagibacterium sp. TaxID=1967288 RepID=UPI003BA95291